MSTRTTSSRKGMWSHIWCMRAEGKTKSGKKRLKEILGLCKLPIENCPGILNLLPSTLHEMLCSHRKSLVIPQALVCSYNQSWWAQAAKGISSFLGTQSKSPKWSRLVSTRCQAPNKAPSAKSSFRNQDNSLLKVPILNGSSESKPPRERQQKLSEAELTVLLWNRHPTHLFNTFLLYLEEIWEKTALQFTASYKLYLWIPHTHLTQQTLSSRTPGFKKSHYCSSG